MAIGEGCFGAAPPGRPGTQRFDQSPDTHRPGKLVGEDGERTIELQLLERGAGREDVEIEDPAKAMVGDEEHGMVQRRGFGVHLQAVVAADEVNSQAAERESGRGEHVWNRIVGRGARGVVRYGGE
jgi:hypothetical protein